MEMGYAAFGLGSDFRLKFKQWETLLSGLFGCSGIRKLHEYAGCPNTG